ncbi:unnamed protein product, partial [Lymnaea stagnalis]
MNQSNVMEVYVGARPFLQGDPSNLVGYFKGCVREISFNNQSLLYVNSTMVQPGAVVSTMGITNGCQ